VDGRAAPSLTHLTAHPPAYLPDGPPP
jgi:hypothetical protein